MKKEGGYRSVITWCICILMLFVYNRADPVLAINTDELPGTAASGCTISENCESDTHQSNCPKAQRSNAHAKTIKRITGFEHKETEPGHPLRTITADKKVSADELDLPNTLTVFLDHEKETAQIPVEWSCTDEDTAKSKGVYTFSPKWDEQAYELDPALSQTDIPYIEVRIEAKAASKARTQNLDTVITVEGANVSKTGIQKAIDSALDGFSADNPAGDVTLVLNPSQNKVVINNSLSELTYINLPVDKGVDSFTITTTKEGATKENPVILFVELGSGANVFANGIPLTIEGAISVGGNIYGGGSGSSTGSTQIVYNGASSGYNRTAIYGGGYNADVNGSTTIRVDSSNAAFNTGVTFSINGGGFAEGDGKAAHVTGSTHIDLHAPVVYVNGGGTAYSGGQANVNGDTDIQFQDGSSLLNKVYGGGHASNYVDNANTTSAANVKGTCRIAVNTKLAQDRYDGDYLVGGGYANIGGNSTSAVSTSSAIADVGNVDIRVKADITTNTQSTTDRCIVGGGDIDGRSHANPNAASGMDICRANVTGDVLIDVAPGINLNNAIIGGGSCFGGNCDVLGNINLKVSDRVTLGGLVGGGVVNCNTYRPGSADAGQVNITLGDQVSIKKIGPSNGHFIGGGSPRYRSGTSYTPSGSHANVKGNITTKIGDQLACEGWFYGAGVGWIAETNAIVEGNVSTSIGKDASISDQFMGGGGAEASNSNVSVLGKITNTIGGNFSCSYFTAAGRSITNASAAVGTAEHSASVSTSFQGSGKDKAQFKGFLVGAGRAYTTPGADATVYGDAALQFDGVIPNQPAYGGGYASADGTKAPVTGTVSPKVSGTKAAYSQYLYGGGYAAADGAAADVGSVSLKLSNNQEMANWTFGGGYANGSSTASARVLGPVSIQVNDSSLTSARLLGGGWGDGGGHTEITGNTSITLCDSTVAYLYGSGYYSAANGYQTAGSIEINLENTAVTGQLYPSGHNNARAKETSLHIIGNTTLAQVGKADTAALSDGLTVYIGDGKTETHVKAGYFYESAINLLKIYDKAILTHQFDGTNPLLFNVRDLQLDDGGTLEFSEKDESISGNFAGGGTLQLNAGQKLSAGGTVSGDSALKINGTPAVGQVYITSKKADGDFSYQGNGMALQQQKTDSGSAWKIVSVFNISASVSGGHGTITPHGTVPVLSGEDQTFDFTPDAGYKVEQILLDNRSVDERSQSYTIHKVSADHTLQVTFAPLVAQDVKEAVETITPPEQDKEQHQEDILDAKIIYEQLPSEEKANVPDTTLEELNKGLAELGTIDIRLEKDVNISTEVDSPNLHDLASAITREEAEQLKAGEMSQIRLKLVINPLDDGTEQIRPEETPYTIGMHMDISILKQVDGGESEKVSETTRPIRIVTAIPPELQAPERTYVMLRSHDGKIDVLPDLDKDSKTITVESNLFSVYTIAYTEPSAPVIPDKTFTVQFDSQGGSTIPPIKDVVPGSLIPAPQEPTKEGFAFDGWYKEPSLENIWHFDKDTVQQDMILYAKWIQEDQSMASASGNPPQTAAGQEGVSATGDFRTGLWLPVCLLLLSGLTLICLYLFTKKRRRKHS